MSYAPFIRIFLRYAAGALVAKGLIDAETGQVLAMDPDVFIAVEIAAGVIIAAVSEIWYAIARKRGET
ncbi:MAG: hypothetical protein ACPG61_17125 [Paracoccaceae bacterium]